MLTGQFHKMYGKPFIHKCRCHCNTWYLTIPFHDQLAADTWQTAIDLLEIIYNGAGVTA